MTCPRHDPHRIRRMNSPAIKQNAPSWSELFARHLDVVKKRASAALASTGYDALLLHSGTPPLLFLDDHHLPYPRAGAIQGVGAAGRRTGFVRLLHARQEAAAVDPSAGGLLAPVADHARCLLDPGVRHRQRGQSARRRAAPCPGTCRAPPSSARPTLSCVGWGPGAINPQHLLAQLDYARAAKTPYEFACLREANLLGARGHLAAERAFRAGASEFEIALEFMKACGLREQELPYNPIVALNEHGAVLHYQFQERRAPAKLHALLIDAGAEFAGYASDITRTYSYDDAEFAGLIRSSTPCSSSCARRCAPASTGAISTRPRIAPSANSCARSASST